MGKYYDHYQQHRYLIIEYVQSSHFNLPVLASLVLYLLKAYVLKVMMLINVLFLYLHVHQIGILI